MESQEIVVNQTVKNQHVVYYTVVFRTAVEVQFVVGKTKVQIDWKHQIDLKPALEIQNKVVDYTNLRNQESYIPHLEPQIYQKIH